MRLPSRFLLFLLVATAALRADDSLAHVRRAQAMLGAGIDSQVLRIENATRWGRYPRCLHALVFEAGGVVWFYTPGEGTQGFVARKGAKPGLARVLREVEPGFTRWEMIPASAGGGPVDDRPLPNGCLIDCLVALRERVARGESVSRPQLLSYYVNTTEWRRGHTVLTYLRPDGVAVIDPDRLETHVNPTVYASPTAGDPLELARLLDDRARNARWVPLDVPAR